MMFFSNVSETLAELWITMPLEMMALGAEGLLGKRPCGCPEHITKVCSSVISDK